MKKNNKQLGDQGEALAVAYLQKGGYSILETNYRDRFGEIDIIAKQGEYIVFIEVKYRSNMKTGRPAEAVHFYKQKKICHVAKSYARKKKLFQHPIRFDIVELVGERVHIIPFAFETIE